MQKPDLKLAYWIFEEFGFLTNIASEMGSSVAGRNVDVDRLGDQPRVHEVGPGGDHQPDHPREQQALTTAKQGEQANQRVARQAVSGERRTRPSPVLSYRRGQGSSARHAPRADSGLERSIVGLTADSGADSRSPGTSFPAFRATPTPGAG